jgi:nucleoside-diphosphate-sugar epimerase
MNTLERVLVTGAGGQLGGRLVQYLGEKGFAVRALSRRPLHLENDSVETVLGDLSHPDTLDAAMRGIEVVFHCAAHLGGGSDTPDKEIFAVNVGGTRALMERALDAGTRRFVFVSSVAVYGEGDLLDVTEDQQPNPCSAYGRSKVEAERMLHRSSGIEWVILRPCAIYGPEEKRFLPGIVHMMRERCIPLVRNGETFFDLVHVDDVCRALFRAATLPSTLRRTYNVAEGVKRSVLSILKLLAESMGVELSTALADSVSGLDEALLKTLGEHRHFRIDRAREELAYEPAISLERGLKAALAPIRPAP